MTVSCGMVAMVHAVQQGTHAGLVGRTTAEVSADKALKGHAVELAAVRREPYPPAAVLRPFFTKMVEERMRGLTVTQREQFRAITLHDVYTKRMSQNVLELKLVEVSLDWIDAGHRLSGRMHRKQLQLEDDVDADLLTRVLGNLRWKHARYPTQPVLLKAIATCIRRDCLVKLVYPDLSFVLAQVSSEHESPLFAS